MSNSTMNLLTLYASIFADILLEENSCQMNSYMGTNDILSPST